MLKSKARVHVLAVYLIVKDVLSFVHHKHDKAV